MLYTEVNAQSDKLHVDRRKYCQLSTTTVPSLSHRECNFVELSRQHYTVCFGERRGVAKFFKSRVWEKDPFGSTLSFEDTANFVIKQRRTGQKRLHDKELLDSPRRFDRPPTRGRQTPGDSEYRDS